MSTISYWMSTVCMKTRALLSRAVFGPAVIMTLARGCPSRTRQTVTQSQ